MIDEKHNTMDKWNTFTNVCIIGQLEPQSNDRAVLRFKIAAIELGNMQDGFKGSLDSKEEKK